MSASMADKGGDFMDEHTYAELLALLTQLKELLSAAGIEYLAIKCTPKKK
jgi:hypothetical protein